MTEIERFSLCVKARERMTTVRSLLSLAIDGKLAVKYKIGNHVSLVRITSCLGTLQLASNLLGSALKPLETSSEGEYENADKNLFIEIFRTVDELVETAKFNYNYFLELKENPDRNYEELKDAAYKREIVL
jgi:hypothetical protein